MKQADHQYTFPHQHHNINLLWSSLFIEELTRYGISDFCIAPGSRSTPLILAAANHPKVITHVHFDERGLGFLALGLSQASSKPVVIITTSGTAVANLYPAVIEAKQSHIPLIIISADRPPELINCAANQAIDQHKIFADYPVFFAQIPTPTESIKSNYLLTTLNQGLFQQHLDKGPIHFNMAIAEPFYPEQSTINFKNYLSSLKGWDSHHALYTIYHSTQQGEVVNQNIELNAEKVLVLVGRISDKQQAMAIAQFCQQFNLLMFADVQSQLQGVINNITGYDLLLCNQSFKQHIDQADLIIQFSDHLVSKRLTQYIGSTATPIWVVSEYTQRIDPAHCVTQRFVSNAKNFIKQAHNNKTTDKKWIEKIKVYQDQLPDIIKPYLLNDQISEVNSTAYVLNHSTDNIILGNSLAIRLADMFANTNATIYSNRGASGIDGVIATAVGIAKNKQAATALLIGDTSFLYDLNSLALLTQLQHPFVIVLLNNDGGGIFNLLPVPKAQHQAFYQLPHGLTFSQTCAQFSIHYQQPKTLTAFKENYQHALAITTHNKATLIEVCISNLLTPIQLAEIKEQLQNAII
ncbi:2-succinyl-5-enolpyruvyl-6-hydroxy-3-cyclohexene-1-carboxylic-acid synthase [Psychromonas sp. SR45-3]|uniref:2-succinyl-5-enolpyruvyl-6-hydroxy-3- cyclohexene-1-carboxylic-acid synthase n=1 Tax=Psychromonas sp. SR45-3 TaxID=2760930 RepID=UPI0015FA1CA4|nr:2-succinyl-5-enolpyruvyl-6-hydroxy-3-cyclohexene-1-carboxylic-acid synthase [Psychromonas sp. SR45-3]MBB1273818.1 2-succinyl-5-enolpyruvyl-6-hydroxy-3-cyclohexene-1-carboxylic-acid synthase [Psychromonas sp. SR45-3]